MPRPRPPASLHAFWESIDISLPEWCLLTEEPSTSSSATAPSVSFYLPTPAALDSHRSSWPNVRQHNPVLETVFARLLHLPTFLAVILLRYCTIWTCGLHIATDTSAYFSPCRYASRVRSVALTKPHMVRVEEVTGPVSRIAATIVSLTAPARQRCPDIADAAIYKYKIWKWRVVVLLAPRCCRIGYDGDPQARPRRRIA